MIRICEIEKNFQINCLLKEIKTQNIVKVNEIMKKTKKTKNVDRIDRVNI